MGAELRQIEVGEARLVLPLLAQFQEETGGEFALEPVYASSRVAALCLDDRSLALGLFCDGSMSGVLLATVSEYFGAPLLQSNEIAWYIEPGSRGRHGMRMLDEYVRWARQQGASYIFTGAHDDRAAPIYRRRGFRRVDTNWVTS